MKFMASVAFPRARQQAVPENKGLAVAEAEGTRSGFEGQHSRHRPGRAAGINKGLAQNQQPTTFSQNGHPPAAGRSQGGAAARGGGQGGSMEFWIASRKHHRPAIPRQGLVRQRTPVPHLQPEGNQHLCDLRVEEMEGPIPGDHHGASPLSLAHGRILSGLGRGQGDRDRILSSPP